MSGYGTKKPGGDYAVQLTFPAVFTQQYVADDTPLKYAPDVLSYAQQWIGTDDQANLHNIWAKEAHQRVMDGVYATNVARQRAFTSPNGYFGLPKAVLGQRHLGFQTGALQSGNIYGGMLEGGLSGGVLRTKQGQDYAKSLLQKRMEQLNKLEGVVLPPRTMETQLSTEEQHSALTESARFELQTIMDSLASAIDSGRELTTSLTEQFLRFTNLLARFMIEANKDETDIIIENLQSMVEGLAVYDNKSAGDVAVLYGTQLDNVDRGRFLFNLVSNLLKYAEGMRGVINMSARDKKVKSASLLRSLNLSSIQRVSVATADRSQKALRLLDKIQRNVASKYPNVAEADIPKLIKSFQRNPAHIGLSAKELFDANSAKLWGHAFDKVVQEVNMDEFFAGRDIDSMREEQVDDMRIPRGMRDRDAQERGDQTETSFSHDNRPAFGRNASRTGDYYGDNVVVQNSGTQTPQVDTIDVGTQTPFAEEGEEELPAFVDLVPLAKAIPDRDDRKDFLREAHAKGILPADADGVNVIYQVLGTRATQSDFIQIYGISKAEAKSLMRNKPEAEEKPKGKKGKKGKK